jgi:hypothetical protein
MIIRGMELHDALFFFFFLQHPEGNFRPRNQSCSELLEGQNSRVEVSSHDSPSLGWCKF